MVSVIWAISLWVLILLLIPFERIKRLWKVMIISFIWMFIVDFTFARFGYYRFPETFMRVLDVPLFYLIGGSAGGIILVNWLPRRSFFKAVHITACSILLLAAERIFIFFGAFEHVNWSILLGLTQNIAGLSLLALVCSDVVGEQTVYKGK